MTDKPNIDGAKADARTLLADIKQLADPGRGRTGYAIEAVLTVASSHYDPKPAEALIEAAEQGDPIAKKAVHLAIMWYVTHGDPVPDRLREYLAELLARDYGPRKKAGHRNYLRDQLIRRAIKAVCDHGFNPTRNPASKGPCGCSIVLDVLAESGVHLSEKTIEEILGKSAKLSRMT
jgi:hypothetical protein